MSNTNPLLSPAEQAHVDALRARWGGFDGDTHPTPLPRTVQPVQPDNGLIPIFNVTWGRFISALIVAFNGGAYVGGNLIPVTYELVQGVHDGLPFLFNGLGLAVCGAVAHALHDPTRNVGFALAQTLLTSWI